MHGKVLDYGIVQASEESAATSESDLRITMPRLILYSFLHLYYLGIEPPSVLPVLTAACVGLSLQTISRRYSRLERTSIMDSLFCEGINSVFLAADIQKSD